MFIFCLQLIKVCSRVSSTSYVKMDTFEANINEAVRKTCTESFVLKEKQKAALRAICEKRDCICVLPTGTAYRPTFLYRYITIKCTVFSVD